MRSLLTLLAALLAANATQAADPLPIFDAHVHYSHDAWEMVPPKEAIAILRKAGVKRALVSSSNDDGTQKLYAEAPDLIIPELRPYRTRGEIGTWFRSDTMVGAPRRPAEALQVRGDRRVPPVRRRCRPAGAAAHGAVGERVQAVPARAFGCRRDRAHVQAGPERAHPLGALGFRPTGEGARDAAQAQEPVGRPGVSQRPRQRRQGQPRVARRLHGVSRPLHGRHRHLHAGALALHHRARQLVARLARRPAARGRREARLQKRRGYFRQHDGTMKNSRLWKALVAGALLLADSGLAWADCEATGGARRVEGRDVVLAFKTRPAKIKVGELFAVDLAVCPKKGTVRGIGVDASMPEHKHGMNYKPTVKKNPTDGFTATGMMFHMPGRWQFAFAVDSTAGRERLLDTVAVD